MQRPYDAHGANAVIKITVFTPLLCVQCVDAADFAVNVTPAVQIGAAVFFVHIRVVGRNIDVVFPILSGDFRQFVQQLSGNSLMTVRGEGVHEAAPRAEFRCIHAVAVGQRRKRRRFGRPPSESSSRPHRGCDGTVPFRAAPSGTSPRPTRRHEAVRGVGAG